MTSPKWLIGILTAFVLLTLLNGILEGVYLGEGTVTRLQTLMSLPTSLAWFSNLWGVLWFDYSFFHGGWIILKYALFWPISLGLLISYGALLVQSIIGGLGRIVGLLTGGA